MGTSRTVAQFAGKNRAAAAGLEKGLRPSLEKAMITFQAQMRVAAAAAAGPDRKLRNKKGAGVLAADGKVYGRGSHLQVIVKARGPWGIRDNSYVGGRTKRHTITPRNARLLSFTVGGRRIARPRVNHPGSSRAPFWQTGTERARPLVVKGLSDDAIRIVASAFGNPFSSRR